MQQEHYLLPRTGKQCRERWYNHLDPQINKAEWTEEEEAIIFEAHRRHGNKWKEIARNLQGRTDNSVKNHFYSTLRRSLRRINKFLGSKNSTSQMRDIKPSVLSRILDFTMESQSNDQETSSLSQAYRDLPSLIFEFSNFKPVKDNILNRSDIMTNEERARFELIISKILEFNEHYDSQKKSKGRGRKKGTVKVAKKKQLNGLSKELPNASPIKEEHIEENEQAAGTDATAGNPLHEEQLGPGAFYNERQSLTLEHHYYHSDGELEDNNMLMDSKVGWNEVRDPSMRSQQGQLDLMVVGTPMKLNVPVLGNQGTDEYPLYYNEEPREEIIEINYID